MNTSSMFARVQFDERDGHIHAFSDDVPGLNICGEDEEKVREDVLGAIIFIYKNVRKLGVKAEWAPKENLLKAPTRIKEYRDIALELEAA